MNVRKRLVEMGVNRNEEGDSKQNVLYTYTNKTVSENLINNNIYVN